MRQVRHFIQDWPLRNHIGQRYGSSKRISAAHHQYQQRAEDSQCGPPPPADAAGQQEATRWSEGSASLLLSTLRSSLFLYWFMAGFTAAQAEFAHARRSLATRQAGTFLFSLSRWFCYADKDAWRLFLEGPVMNRNAVSFTRCSPPTDWGTPTGICRGVLSSVRVFVCEWVHLFCVVAVFESANDYSIDERKKDPQGGTTLRNIQMEIPVSSSLIVVSFTRRTLGTLGHFNYLHVNRWQWPREIFNCPWSLKPQI